MNRRHDNVGYNKYARIRKEWLGLMVVHDGCLPYYFSTLIWFYLFKHIILVPTDHSDKLNLITSFICNKYVTLGGKIRVCQISLLLTFFLIFIPLLFLWSWYNAWKCLIFSYVNPACLLFRDTDGIIKVKCKFYTSRFLYTMYIAYVFIFHVFDMGLTVNLGS